MAKAEVAIIFRIPSGQDNRLRGESKAVKLPRALWKVVWGKLTIA
jgi:hypothetical protein